jgi:hypothetical protein
MASESRWTIEAYTTEQGEAPAWSFIRSLTGRDRIEAIALVKLLEAQGNQLRRPHSGVLGDALFELRGKQVRLFYMFLPRRVIVLLAGEIKKRDAIPAKTLALARGYQRDVLRRQGKRG